MRFAVALLVGVLVIGVGLADRKDAAQAVQGPTVRIANGALAGRVQGGTRIFEGIPFAAAPVGNLRWREPQPATNWQGTRDATHPGHVCSQAPGGINGFLGPLAEAYGTKYSPELLEPSEDCLYLNVFSPWPTGSKPLPVMVWLHGGSNRAGSGSSDGYNGSSLAAHQVIVVTMNYRLGVMGFFAHPGLTAESAHHSSGNYGLLDQIAGLRWVQQNVAQFGGDAGNVTLFGESAGSVDATTLMASPLARGLFRRVIAESGPAFGLGPEVKLADAEAVGKAVGDVAALRRLSAEQVAEMDARVVGSRYKSFDPNGAVVDGWLLPMAPAKAYASGKIQKVELMAGLNGRELSAFRLAASAAAKRSAKPVEKESPTAAMKKLEDAARPLYGGWTNVAVATYLAQILMHGDVAVDQASNDMLVACPVGAEVSLVSSGGERAYLYRFDRAIPGKGEQTLGAFHSLELPFVFNTFGARNWQWLPVTAADRKLSETIEVYWTNFAKTGDPNGLGVPGWSAWNDTSQPYMQFTPAASAVEQKSFAPRFCRLDAKRVRDNLNGN